jgi:hypothetical protein
MSGGIPAVPSWEQLFSGVQFGPDAWPWLDGNNIDLAAAAGRKLWDLPYQLAACAPNPGSGLVIAGPPFFNFNALSAAGPPFFNFPSTTEHDWGEHLFDVLRCIVAGQYRLFLVIIFLFGCIFILYILLIAGAGCLCVALLAMVFGYASDNPSSAAAVALVIAVQRWREWRGDRRPEQQQQQQQQCELPKLKLRQPRRKQRK